MAWMVVSLIHKSLAC